jgi:hypothetical protein
MPPTERGNSYARQRRRARPRPMVPHGPGGQMLRPAPRHRYIPPSARAQNRPRSGANLFHPRTRVRPASPRAQVRQSRAAARYFVSQGRAVERVANQRHRQQQIARVQRRIVNQARAQAKYYVSQGADIDKRARQGTLPGQSDRSRDLALIMHGAPVNKAILALGGYDALLKRMNVPKAQRRAAGLAPAIWALDQVSRPVYGVAGGADAAVRGKGVKGIARGVSRGVQLKDKTLFSDVLKHAGVKNKTVRAVAGFGLDVALDPTTYMTFGLSSVGGHAVSAEARSLARSAARATQRDLAKKVASGAITKKAARAQAKDRARDIERSVTARRVKQGRTEGHKGLTVQVAGAKTVRRVAERAGLKPTATLAPVTRATRHGHATGKFLVSKGRRTQDARKVARQMASEAHGGVRPPDLNKAQEALVKGMRRETRAEGEATARRVAERSNALLDRLSEHERRDVIDAIEADKIGRLKGQAKPLAPPRLHAVRAVRSAKTRHNPDRLFDVAVAVRSDLRHLNRVGRRSGLLAGQVGKGSRTRAEAQLSARASTPPALRPVRQKLARAQQERVAAVKQRAQATTPAQKRAAEQELAGATDRVQNLRRQLQGTQARRRTAVHAQRRVKAISERRFSSEVRDAERAHADALAAHAQLRQESHTAARLQASRKHVVATKRALADARARTPVTHDEAKGFVPRTNADDVEAQGGFLRRMAAGLEKPDDIPRAEQLGANKPRAGTAERRAYRKPRAVLEQGSAKEQAVAGALTSDVRETLSRYGTSVARASAGRNLNTKLIQSGQKLPRNLSMGDLAALKAAGKSVYRVRRGVLEKVDDTRSPRGPARATQAGARPGQRAAAASTRSSMTPSCVTSGRVPRDRQGDRQGLRPRAGGVEEPRARHPRLPRAQRARRLLQRRRA